jgi:hypothetical protein
MNSRPVHSGDSDDPADVIDPGVAVHGGEHAERHSD